MVSQADPLHFPAAVRAVDIDWVRHVGGLGLDTEVRPAVDVDGLLGLAGDAELRKPTDSVKVFTTPLAQRPVEHHVGYITHDYQSSSSTAHPIEQANNIRTATNPHTKNIAAHHSRWLKIAIGIATAPPTKMIKSHNLAIALRTVTLALQEAQQRRSSRAIGSHGHQSWGRASASTRSPRPGSWSPVMASRKRIC